MSGKSAPERSLGPSVNPHHWIPKSKGGDQARDIHVVCHRMLHRTFSESELATEYATPEVLRGHPDIESFVRWVRRKQPQFIDRAKSPRGRGKRRPHRRRR